MNDKKDNFLDVGQIRVTKPFGPSIAWVKIPPDLIKNLNSYIDKVIEDKKKLNDLDWGKTLVGDVTQEFRLEKNFSEKLVGQIFLQKVLLTG